MLIQKVISRIKKHIERVSGIAKPTEVAAIHATVLSIMIGVFSAYFLYVHGEIRGKQMEAMNKAEEVNKIEFVRSAYMPRGKDMFMAEGSGDITRVKQDLVELALLMSMRPGGTSIKEGQSKIPENPAERAERILQIMNVVSHRYPFPKALADSSQFRPEPILFTDIGMLREWLRDLREVLTPLRLVTDMPPLLNPSQIDPYLDSLALREKENIKKSRTDPFLQITGERNPYILINNFINGMHQADEIYYSTNNALTIADNLQANSISKLLSLVMLFGGFAVFVSSVILPLVSRRLNAFWYIHLPLLYYASICFMIVIKVMRL
jgi:hypothetical protein